MDYVIIKFQVLPQNLQSNLPGTSETDVKTRYALKIFGSEVKYLSSSLRLMG